MATYLYISDTLVDINNNEPIPIVKSVSDITNLSGGSTKGNYSIPFKIPATKSNKLLFKFPELVTNEAFNGNVELSARLEVDGAVILDGIARIKEVNESNGVIKYSIILYDGNSSWINALKGKKLSELDLSEFDHVYDKYTIDQSENTFFDQLVVYGLTNYGQPLGGTSYKIEDRMPYLRAHIIFRKIFKDIGYEIAGNFIDSDYFKKLFITPNEFPSITDAQVEDNKFRILLSSANSDASRTVPTNAQKPLPFDTGSNVGNDVYFDTVNQDVKFGIDNKFTSNITASMSFEVDFSVRNYQDGIGSGYAAGDERVLQIFLTVNGIERYSENITIPKVTFGFSESDQVNVNFLTKSMLIKKGDVVRLVFRAEFVSALLYSEEIRIDSGAIFRNKVFKSIIRGMDVVVTGLLPDATQLDFISDFKELHNLHFYNEEIYKRVTIEPRDEFYNNDALDWSNKLDLSNDVTISHLGSNLKKVIRFMYKNDSADKNIVRKEEEYNEKEPYGSKSVDILNVNAKDGILDKKLKIFSSTWTGKALIGSKNAIIPIMWTSDDGRMPTQRSTKFNTRLLYWNGVKTIPNGESWNWERTQRTTYPQFTMNEDGVQNDNSLLFEDTSYSLGLFNRYWLNSHNTINNGRIYKVKLYLDAVDLLNLDFRIPIYIARLGDGHYFHIKKVEYDANNVGVASVELVKVLNNLAPVVINKVKGAVNYKENEIVPVIQQYLTTVIPTTVVINSVSTTVDIIYDVYGKSMGVNNGNVVLIGGINKIEL